MPTQRDLSAATTVNALLKQCATTTAMSACECTSTDLRATFADISQTAIRRQEQLSALMMQKGWYVPPVAEEATVNALRPQLEIAMGATATGGTMVGGAMTTGTVSGQTLTGSALAGGAMAADMGTTNPAGTNVTVPRIM